MLSARSVQQEHTVLGQGSALRVHLARTLLALAGAFVITAVKGKTQGIPQARQGASPVCLEKVEVWESPATPVQ